MLVMMVSLFTVMALADTVPYKDCERAHDVLNPAEGDTKYPAVEADCVTKGTPLYYKCSECGGYYWQGVGGVGNAKSYSPEDIDYFKTNPDKHHSQLTHTPAKDPTCKDEGNIEYYSCADCDKKFSDEAGKEEITGSVTIPATGVHVLTHVEAKAATCKENGNKEYWQCEDCGKLFKDSKGKKEITDPTSVIIPKSEASHKLVKTAKVAAKCETEGTEAYYTCSVCSKMFSDSRGKNEIQAPVKIAALGHNYEYKLTDKVTGKELWQCTRCGKTEFRNPDETTYTLTVVIRNGDEGVVRQDGTKVENKATFQLKKGEKMTFTAEPDTAKYKAVWSFGDDEKTADSYTVTMGKKDAKLYVEFVRKGSSTAKTLTVDITGKHGKVTQSGDRVYDGDTFKLYEDDKITFKADPDSGYKAVWTYKGDEETGNSCTVKMGSKSATLYVKFVEKSEKDDDHTLTVDISGAKHGTVTRGGSKVYDGDTFALSKNETRTFKADPDKGYVAVWTFGGESYVGNSYTVKMGSKNATLYVEFMDEDDVRLTKLPFTDVKERNWFYDDVVYVYRNNLMDGVSSTKFAPNQNTTRAQIVTILWRLTGEPVAARENGFYDVSSRAYYSKAVSWAAEAGIVDGYDAHTFKPDANVTREQLAAILYRYAEYMNLSTKGKSTLTWYADYNQISTWAKEAMAWANYHGLIEGTDRTHIAPKGYATRAQIAAILHRFAVEYGA